MQFVVEQRGFECLSLEVYKKKKNSFQKKGMRQLLSLSLGLNEFQAARVSAWQESRHPVSRTTQRILFSSSWVLIVAVRRVKNKMSVFWEEPWDVPCQSCGPAPVPSRLPDMMLWRLFAWHLISARLSFGYLANRGDITGPGLFSVTILSPRQRDWSDPSPHPHDP